MAKPTRFDLQGCAYLKVPKTTAEAFIEKFGKEKWSEWARECLDSAVQEWQKEEAEQD